MSPIVIEAPGLGGFFPSEILAMDASRLHFTLAFLHATFCPNHDYPG